MRLRDVLYYSRKRVEKRKREYEHRLALERRAERFDENIDYQRELKKYASLW